MFTPFFHIFPCFLNLFHQKVWVKYQLDALNTWLLVKNVITNIRTKFKVFQIHFPPIRPIFPYFIIFSEFVNIFRFSKFINWFFKRNSFFFAHLPIFYFIFVKQNKKVSFQSVNKSLFNRSINQSTNQSRYI